jgi:uncharacterized protein (UPF0332 family)
MSSDRDRIELAKYRLTQASERLEAARILVEASMWNDAITRSYYAIFTGARSVLALYNLDSKKHSGVISLFNRHVVKPGFVPKTLSKIITNARKGREASDYADFIEFTKEEAEEQYRQAQEFVNTVKDIIDKIIKEEIVLSPLSPDLPSKI